VSENLSQTWHGDRPAETMGTPLARRFQVKYSFQRVQREMEQMFPLAPGEQRIKGGLISVRRLGFLGGPGVALVTDRRMCVLVHYFFRFDRGFEFPRGSLVGVRRIDLFPTAWFLRLSFRTDDGLAHLDISDVQAATLSVGLMGQPVKTRHLVESIQRTWGSQAPVLETPLDVQEGSAVWLRRIGSTLIALAALSFWLLPSTWPVWATRVLFLIVAGVVLPIAWRHEAPGHNTG
jgi:hypothetical protein